jgi:hypothetical protein
VNYHPLVLLLLRLAQSLGIGHDAVKFFGRQFEWLQGGWLGRQWRNAGQPHEIGMRSTIEKGPKAFDAIIHVRQQMKGRRAPDTTEGIVERYDMATAAMGNRDFSTHLDVTGRGRQGWRQEQDNSSDGKAVGHIEA